MRKVCFAYQWATYGGVERVFLNRAHAFREAGHAIEIDVYYGSDGGGLESFKQTIHALGLDSLIHVVPKLDPEQYEAVFIIDSPDLLPKHLSGATRWIVECHTAYAANRAYLDRVPEDVSAIAVPSRTFASMLAAERPTIASKIRLLRNCVSPVHGLVIPRLPGWTQRPVLYFGRLDELKNPQGFIDLLAELERRAPGQYFGIALGPEVPGYDMSGRIDKAGLRGRLVQLPPITFTRTSAFLAAWRERGGVMVSPSRGESFGLAAAESIAAGVPVLLTALPEHSELVSADTRHLYDLDDVKSGADKVEAMFHDYPECSRRMRLLADEFSSAAFIADWRALMVDPGNGRVCSRTNEEARRSRANEEARQ